MTGRYIVRTQDDYFNVTDTFNNVPIFNGIRTEIDAEWLCDTLNSLHKENEELRQENKKILNTINNKITEKGIDWYGAEDNSKEEKEANLQLNILEEIRDELKEILNLIKGD